MSDTPDDFSTALKKDGLELYFSGCTPAHRREYLQWISSAKRPETRKDRIEKAVKMILAKCAMEKVREKRKS